MSEWRECKLWDVVEIVDSLHKTPKEYFETGYPMVRVTDVKKGKLDLSQTLKVDKGTFEEFSKKYRPKKDDIIFTRVGSYGNTCIVGDDTNFCLGQNTVFIIPRENAKFLYYFLNSPDAKVQIEASAGGSTQPTVSLKSIKEYDIFLPPLEEQKAIAGVLSSLDDKIDLLHRQNHTLESLAQTLFRQWFIEEAKDEWDVGTLDDIVDFNPTYKLKQGELATYLAMENVQTDRSSTGGWYKRETASGAKFMNDDTLLARITPSLENGKTAFVDFLEDGEIGWGSTEFIVMRMKNGILPQFVKTTFPKS